MPFSNPKTADIKDILGRLRPRRSERRFLKTALGIGMFLCGVAVDEGAWALWHQRPMDIADQVVVQAMMLRENELSGESMPSLWDRNMREIGVDASTAMTHAQARTLAQTLTVQLVKLAGPSLRAPRDLMPMVSSPPKGLVDPNFARPVAAEK